ncbi:hypothetical protein AcV5_004343 [Taiwanofungus camphoratus]|nr:hypothetical protein AcV5_004343 [Antrodia cinnamomea]
MLSSSRSIVAPRRSRPSRSTSSLRTGAPPFLISDVSRMSSSPTPPHLRAPLLTPSRPPPQGVKTPDGRALTRRELEDVFYHCKTLTAATS